MDDCFTCFTFKDLLSQLESTHEAEVERLHDTIRNLESKLRQLRLQKAQDALKRAARSGHDDPPQSIKSFKSIPALPGVVSIQEHVTMDAWESKEEGDSDIKGRPPLVADLEEVRINLNQTFGTDVSSSQLHAIVDLATESRMKYNEAVDVYRTTCNEAWIALETYPDHTGDEQLCQGTSNLEELWTDAKEAQNFLEKEFCPSGQWEQLEDGSNITFDPALKLRFCASSCQNPGIKGKDRIQQKCKIKYGSDVKYCLDVSRFALQYDTAEDLCAGLEKLMSCKAFHIAELRNRFREPTALGWRDIQLLIQAESAGPNGRKHYTELQLQLKDMADVRKSAHDIYARLRVEIVSLNVAAEEVDDFLTHIVYVLSALPSRALRRHGYAVKDDDLVERTNIFGRNQPRGRYIFASRSGVIHPQSALIFYWNVLMGIVVVGIVYVLPMEFSSGAEHFLPPIVNWVMFAIFVLDILVNFNTAYEESISQDGKATLQLRRHLIALNYIRHSFWLDILSTIPFDLFLDSSGGLSLKYARVLKFGRILKLLKIPAVFQKIQMCSEGVFSFVQEIAIKLGVSSSMIATMLPFRIGMTIFKLLCVLFTIAHHAACLMIWWSDNELSFHEAYALFMPCAFTGIATGALPNDCLPRNADNEWLFLTIVIEHVAMLCGIIYYFASFPDAGLEHADITSQRNTLTYHMVKNEVPRDLRKAVNAHFQEYARAKPEESVTAIVSSLPKDLRIKISSAIYVPALDDFTLFHQGAWQHDHEQLKVELAYRMESRVYRPRDPLMFENKVLQKLMYVREGHVWYGNMKDENETETLDSVLHMNLTSYAANGHIFGEIALFCENDLDCVPECSVIARSFVTCYVLLRSSFQEAMQTRPHWMRFLQFIGSEVEQGRLNCLGLCKRGLTKEQVSRWVVEDHRGNLP